MTLALAVVAWGTLATAAWTHAREPRRFGDLLAMHIGDAARAQWAARLTIGTEVVVVLAATVGYFGSLRWLLVASAAAGFVLGVGYVVWVSRLVLNDSGLPCACSFSTAPPSWWSVGRAAVICGFGFFAVAPTVAEVGVATGVGFFVAGAALGTALYALPEALTWPAAALALKHQVTDEVRT